MMTLAFLFAIAAIIGAVLAIEGTGTAGAEIRRPTGLLTWLSSGNWPAKIGGGLLVVGIGALLRYAAINFDIAPSLKLATGVVAAAVLGFAAIVTGRGAAQRAVSLALGGAAFGVAYLTAYSAFALFGYVTSATGLTLLALTSIGAGVFAVTRSALSLALLAMVGAYLAPAFGIGDPGPSVIYGYYAAISLLTLLMVTARGWRPLIHVSFLFTLAGSVFFAWTARYYAPQHFAVMGPLLLVLVALHVAMPIAEHRHVRGPWIERLDVIYLLALPAVVTLLAIVIAPSRLELSTEMIGLGAIWLVAAVALRFLAREGIAAHAVIGTVLIGLGVAARFRGLPWELIALAFSVGALELAVRRSTSGRLHSFLAGLVLLLGAVQIITSLAPIADGRAFLNAPFIERLVGAALLIVAGRICRRAGQALDTLLLSVGVGWAIIAIGAEIIRWDLVSVALFLHWALILAAATVFFMRSRAAAADPYVIPLAIGVAATAIFASDSALPAAAWVNLIVAPLAMIALAVRPGDSHREGSGRVAAAIVAPIVAVIWAQHAGYSLDIRAGQFPVSAAALAAVVTLIVGRALPERSVGWYSTVTPLFGVTFAIILGVVTLFDIERHIWAVTLELLCLGGLVFLALTSRDDRDVAEWLGPSCIVGGALLLQANLLRWLGPPGDLTVADVTRMDWPTLVSLLWAAIGAALTLWGRKSVSRTLWVGGATLLVAAAIKLVLVDFGSLGELANILAVIAAGGVFLLVGWLAPMPPAAPAVSKQSPPPSRPPPSPATTSAPTPAPIATAAARMTPAASRSESPAPRSPTQGSPAQEGRVMPEAYWKRPAGEAADATRADGSSRKIGWTIALIAAGILILTRCGHPVRDLIGGALSDAAPPATQPFAEPIPDPVPPQLVEPPRDEAAIASATPIESPPERAPIPPPLVDNECTQWAAQLPEDYEVHVAGAYKGRELDFPLGSSNHAATAFDVTVNVPGRNVVLALGAYEPSIWTVRRSPDTRIVGVWLSGYHTQEVIGLQADTPLLKSSYENGSACPHFYFSSDNPSGARDALDKVLGRVPESYVTASGGRVTIGRPGAVSNVAQAERKTPEDFRDPSLPLAGDKGIDQLLGERKLRRATADDLAQWRAVAGSSKRGADSSAFASESGPFLFRTYVVQGPMTLPAGLYGAHSATFIVPRGVPQPVGNPGHSRILDMNQ